MPNRLLKEGIVDSSAIDGLTAEEEVFFYRLLVVSDDFGRMDARLPILKSKCFPLKENLKLEKFEVWMNSLVRQGLAIRYQVTDKSYIQILKWEQRVRSKEKYPSADCGQVTDNCPTYDGVGRGLGLGKGKGKGKGYGGNADISNPTRFSKDEILKIEWIDFCKNERPDLDPQKIFDDFKDFWISKPKDNKKLDWFATWRGWIRRQNKTLQNKSDEAWDGLHELSGGLLRKKEKTSEEAFKSVSQIIDMESENVRLSSG